jgi:multiple sugar transport system substrate-binding protein
MFYNKTVFQDQGWQVPTTWAEMEALCAEIKEFNKDIIPLGYDSDDNLFITMCEQYNIPYTTNENITKPSDHFLFNNTQAKDMVSRIKSWHSKGWLTTKGSSTDGAYTSTKFKNGELYMTIGSTGGTTYNYSDNFEIGIAPIPGAEATVEGGNNHVIMQGPSICFLRRVTQAQKEASWKFYKYLVNAENSANFGSKTGYSPVRKSSFTTSLWEEFMTDSTIVGAEDLVRRTVDFNSSLNDRYFVSATFKSLFRKPLVHLPPLYIALKTKKVKALFLTLTHVI